MIRRTGGRRPRCAVAIIGALVLSATLATVDGPVMADAATRANAERATVSGLTPQMPTAVAVSPDGRTLLVAAEIDAPPGGAVSIVDTATGAVRSTVSGVTGGFPDQALFTPSGDTALVGSSDSQVMVIDAQRSEQTNLVNDYSGANPVGMAMMPDGSTAVIANSGDGTISIVDVGTLSVVGLAGAGTAQPWGIAISPDGRLALVTDRSTNSVAVLEWRPGELTFVEVADITGFDDPVAVEFTRDGSAAYVANSGIRTGTRGSIDIIDVAARKRAATVGGYDGTNPMDLALTPEGDAAYVADFGSDSVSVISTTTNTQVDTVSGFSGIQPVGVAIAPDGVTAYVANMGDTESQPATPGSVSILDITAPPAPPGPPTIDVVSPDGGQLTAVFTPGATGTLPNTGYTMNVYLVGQADPAGSASGAGSPLIVDGLVNGTAYTVEVVANNAAGDIASSSFGPVVVGILPFFTAASPPPARIGRPYRYTFLASGLPVPEISLHTALPDGLTYARGDQPGSGTISGTPTGAGLAGDGDRSWSLDVRAQSVVGTTTVSVPFRLEESIAEPAPIPMPTATPGPGGVRAAEARERDAVSEPAMRGLAGTGGDVPLLVLLAAYAAIAAGGVVLAARGLRRRRRR